MVGPQCTLNGLEGRARCERSASTWAAPSPTSRSGTTRAARWPSSNCPRSRRLPPSALFELQAATRRRSWAQSGTDWVIDSELLLVGQRTHPSFVLAPIGTDWAPTRRRFGPADHLSAGSKWCQIRAQLGSTRTHSGVLRVRPKFELL